MPRRGSCRAGSRSSERQNPAERPARNVDAALDGRVGAHQAPPAAEGRRQHRGAAHPARHGQTRPVQCLPGGKRAANGSQGTAGGYNCGLPPTTFRERGGRRLGCRFPQADSADRAPPSGERFDPKPVTIWHADWTFLRFRKHRGGSTISLQLPLCRRRTNRCGRGGRIPLYQAPERHRFTSTDPMRGSARRRGHEVYEHHMCLVPFAAG